MTRVTPNERVERFLELVCERLEAADARFELGGRGPDDPRQLVSDLGDGWRLVAVFDEAPVDAELLHGRLERLAGAFEGVVTAVQEAPPDIPEVAEQPDRRALDETLDALRAIAGAVSAVVVDASTPVIWGSSEPSRAMPTVDAALALARGVEHPQAGSDPVAVRRDTLTAEAIAEIREHGVPEDGHVRSGGEGELGLVAREFGGAYALVLAFDGPFSEVAAEGAALRALPVVERLVASLPPWHPGPEGGSKAKVVRLRPA